MCVCVLGLCLLPDLTALTESLIRHKHRFVFPFFFFFRSPVSPDSLRCHSGSNRGGIGQTDSQPLLVHSPAKGKQPASQSAQLVPVKSPSFSVVRNHWTGVIHSEHMSQDVTRAVSLHGEEIPPAPKSKPAAATMVLADYPNLVHVFVHVLACLESFPPIPACLKHLVVFRCGWWLGVWHRLIPCQLWSFCYSIGMALFFIILY